jgi:hypothetical protein
VEQVGGLIGHEEFGAVGGSEDERACVAETADGFGVFGRDVPLVEEAADLAAVAGGRDRGFYGHGKAMQGSARAFGRVQPVRLAADSLGVEIDECVQGGVEALDLLNVGFGEFSDGDLAGLQKFQLRGSGLVDKSSHFLRTGGGAEFRSSSGVAGLDR